MKLELTDFQVNEVLKALKKRAQCLRAAERRPGGEEESFQKLIVITGLIEELKAYKKSPG